MLAQLEAAEAVADDLARAYAAASEDIAVRARKIFDTFRGLSGLSEADARALLNRYPTADARALLLAAIDPMPPGPERQRALAQINAPAYQYRIGRLEALQADIDRRLGRLAQQETARTTAHYRAAWTDGYYRQIYDLQRQTGLGFSFARANSRQVEETLAQAWSGAHYAERIWRNTDALAKRVKGDLMAGALSGKSNRAMARQLREDFGVGAYEARRLVRTETAHVVGQAERQSYEACGVGRYRFVATLDLHTSERCQALDGKTFPVADARVGENYPPMHPHCRSTTMADLDPEVLEGLERRARDPATGKTVRTPANLTYGDWAERQRIQYGQDRVDMERKKLRQRRQDAAQLRQYRAVLGDRVPSGLDDYQELKYANPTQWQLRKTDYARRVRLQEHPELALPGAQTAMAADAKFTRYLFNPENRQGYAKGRNFTALLGIEADDWAVLQQALTINAGLYPAVAGRLDSFGQRFTQRQVVYGPNGQAANVKVGWIHQDGRTWMTTAFIEGVGHADDPTIR